MNINHDLLKLFAQFVQQSANGKHKQLNGSRLRPSVVVHYQAVYGSICSFCKINEINPKISDMTKFGKPMLLAEQKRWKKFIVNYATYLYSRGCHDNYVGTHFKVFKVFFNYISEQKRLNCEMIINCFKTISEKIPIIVLDKEHIAFLVGNKNFEMSLTDRLKKTKDIFVVGCYVGLRFGDLMQLKKSNLEFVSGCYYLRVNSNKTGTETTIKLPEYIVAIFEKYKKLKFLLPGLSNGQLNKNVKLLCEKAGWTNIIGKQRSQLGQKKTILKNGKAYRFCDLVTTHTMRRTAITNLLILGMPELLVRQISGHSPGSKAFYRYVTFAQNYVDTAIDKVHLAMNELITKEKNQ